MPDSAEDFRLEQGDARVSSKSLKTLKAPGAPQSKEEKTYHKLKKKIDVLRNEIADWQREIAIYSVRHQKEYLPQLQKQKQLIRQMIELLDTKYDEKKITRTERSKLKHLIRDMCASLLEDAEDDDPELMDIYARYNGRDFNEEAEDQRRFFAEEVLGLEVCDADLSPEAFDRLLEQAMAEESEQREREKQARQERAAKRKKSAKQLEKERQAQQSESDIAKVIREVFRKLASALHPDREPDEQERQRKTDLMQRVNNAYAAKDLLALLNLQLEIEQIDELSLQAMPAHRMQHINKILQEQVLELEMELNHLSGRFKFEFGFAPWESLSAKRLVKSLSDEVIEVKRIIADLERDVRALSDTSNLKSWLKQLRF